MLSIFLSSSPNWFGQNSFPKNLLLSLKLQFCLLLWKFDFVVILSSLVYQIFRKIRFHLFGFVIFGAFCGSSWSPPPPLAIFPYHRLWFLKAQAPAYAKYQCAGSLCMQKLWIQFLVEISIFKFWLRAKRIFPFGFFITDIFGQNSCRKSLLEPGKLHLRWTCGKIPCFSFPLVGIPEFQKTWASFFILVILDHFGAKLGQTPIFSQFASSAPLASKVLALAHAQFQCEFSLMWAKLVHPSFFEKNSFSIHRPHARKVLLLGFSFWLYWDNSQYEFDHRENFFFGQNCFHEIIFNPRKQQLCLLLEKMALLLVFRVAISKNRKKWDSFVHSESFSCWSGVSPPFWQCPLFFSIQALVDAELQGAHLIFMQKLWSQVFNRKIYFLALCRGIFFHWVLHFGQFWSILNEGQVFLTKQFDQKHII